MDIFYTIRNIPNLLRGLNGVADNLRNSAKPRAQLSAKLIKLDGTEKDYGVVAVRMVTTAGVNYIVDSFQDSTADPLDAFSWHGSGTGTTAEAIGDTTLETETGSRVDGTQVEGASPNIYRTVATISYGSTLAITEHGVFSASTSGTLLDRSVFAAINVGDGDSIQFTYELTVNAGG